MANNNKCGIENTGLTYYERTKEAAGIRRILHFAKKEIEQNMACNYTPEEDWTSDTCLHSYDEYLEELKFLQKQLRSFVTGETRQIITRGLNAHCETFEEYVSHGEHETIAGGRIIAFRYPYTRQQYEEIEEAKRKYLCENFAHLTEDIDYQLNAKEGQINAEVVKEYKREKQEVQARLSDLLNSEESSNSTIDEDNMPF